MLNTLIRGLVAFYVVMPPVMWWLDNKRQCPACRRRMMVNLDANAFRDPAPNYWHHRCRNCGAEFVRIRCRWVRRAVWERFTGPGLLNSWEVPARYRRDE